MESSQRLWKSPSSTTPHKTRTPSTGIFIALVWREWDSYTHSTHWRATCSYPIKGIDFRDYLRGNFKDFNIFDFTGEGKCKKVEYVNIRGHVGTDLTAPFWRKLNSWTLHINSPSTHCQFKAARSGAVSSEDNFGWYGNGLSTKFRCTETAESTTQYWFGATANLLRDKTAFQWITELGQSPSDLIFKKHWFIDDFRVVFHVSIFNKIFTITRVIEFFVVSLCQSKMW